MTMTAQVTPDDSLDFDPIVLLQQASVWHGMGDHARAEKAYRQVLAVDPANPDALNLLGLIHHEAGARDAAIRLARAAIKLAPLPRYLVNLAVYLLAHGDPIGSQAAYRRVIREHPGNAAAWAPLIFGGDLHPYSTHAQRLADRRAFNDRHCAALTAAALPHENDPDPDRKLRIGYLGADFRRHSAAMAFGPVLNGYDHDRYEVFCYWQKTGDGPADEITQALADRVDSADEVQGLDDDALAAKIRADKIDILVDLAGYAKGQRLLVLARKPAPIIMTGWGHVTGLGIDACDYLLADAVTVPPDHESAYWEHVLRLPCLMAYEPFETAPIAPPPAIRAGYVTFGYLGRQVKCSEAVWAAWAEILRRVPASRLLLKGQDYTDPSVVERITEFFISLGIEPHRLELRPPSTHADHLAAHNEVDVCLDSFPHTGGVTTLEACYMGVPTVTLLGDHLNARVSGSILTTIDRREWIALDRAEYVDLAVCLAKRTGSLESRQALRSALTSSILMDPARYAAAVEEQYRAAWQSWCRSQGDDSRARPRPPDLSAWQREAIKEHLLADSTRPTTEIRSHIA